MGHDSGHGFITTAQAAAVLGVTTVTVLAYAKRGLLRPEVTGRGWLFDESSVLALRTQIREEHASWISLSEACTVTGLTEYRIKQGVACAQIRTRTAPRNRPTLHRETVLLYARLLTETPPPPPRPSPPAPPDESGVWITSDEAGALLGISRQRIGQLALAERLPATRQGRFWWFRREHIESRAAAAQFSSSTSSST